MTRPTYEWRETGNSSRNPPFSAAGGAEWQHPTKGAAVASTSASAWTDASSNLLKVTRGFVLGAVDPGSTPGFSGNKTDAQTAGAAAAEALSHQQEMLFANSREGDPRKILLILQGMDTSGKGGIVRHVVGAVDPQGVSHVAFKAPTPAELRHDFLWRIRRELPTAGMIGVFDRSHYEDVLIGRVRQLAPPEEIEERYDLINAFEQELVDDDTTVIKVMLHISAGEQKKRLLERLDRPDKYWKFNPGDIDERMLWPGYQAAYQTALERTSTAFAPWYVVPADRKWFAHLAVRELLLKALNDMVLTWPPADFDVAAERARLAAS
ncbi:polyphosphate kinase 2 family protein [Cryobacterium sp. TMB3-1-2]|nr:polyphosphate kinase 2 family protein [Cryobacterium sp. TMB3-1-2]TFC71889.1 polyphosphate kinase 2 family protein [Cryobacterium sp. TMB3-15]TFC78482.1 polyphosphate kinase 2 family protein [Cryobacterium sp. TMB3-10]TFD44539.1 polyphosphate kinase 2 family protein [Cryobacterium sp. TMB3-12]